MVRVYRLYALSIIQPTVLKHCRKLSVMPPEI